MKQEERTYKEIEKRERLVQVLLIIGGFFIAYSKEEVRTLLILAFLQFLLLVILYYVFLSRTKMISLVNWLALSVSLFFGLFVALFFATFSSNLMTDWGFLTLFVLLSVVLTFALVYPGSSEQYTEKITTYLENKEKENPKYFKIIFLILSIVAVILLIAEIILIT